MRYASCVVLLVFSVCALSASETPQSNEVHRPSVGVALSGGGALGLAHVGVLRYFEEHHIPIDDIAGTSMGGLVGGFYATGMDARQISDLAEQADWNLLLNPGPKFINQPIVEKQKWYRTFGDLTLRFGRKFSLPAGWNSGEALALLLSRTTLAYSQVRDFNELPTPFRCVATDLVRGEAVVLQRGSLATALRATMSIPGIFTPVRMDGMVLVDGGLVQTVPVEAVREMGAEKVIAVVLALPQITPDNLKTIADILRRAASVDRVQNQQVSVGHADLVIAIDTGRLSSTRYNNASEIMQAGYEAAQMHADELRAFQVSDEEWNRYVEARRSRMRVAEKHGAVVAVHSPKPSFQRNANSELHRKLGVADVPERRLGEVLSGMVAATGVPSASYQWQQGPGMKEGYAIEFAARPGTEVLVRPSVHYGWSVGEPDRGSLRLSTSTVFENAYKARVLSTLQIGYDPGLIGEFYHPFGGSAFFAAPGALVQRYHVNRYTGPTRSTSTRDRGGGTFYAGFGTWRFAQLRLGLQAGYDSYNDAPAVDGVQARSSGYAAPELRWVVNSQDAGEMPSHGTRIEGAAGYSFRNVSFPYFKNEFSSYHSFGRFATLFASSRQVTSLGRKLDYFEQFTAGGQNQLSAYRYQEFHANTLVTAKAGMIVRDRSARRPLLMPGFAGWYEAGRFDMGSLGWQTHQSTSVALFIPTPLGAAGVSLSVNEQAKARLRVVIGSF